MTKKSSPSTDYFQVKIGKRLIKRILATMAVAVFLAATTLWRFNFTNMIGYELPLGWSGSGITYNSGNCPHILKGANLAIGYEGSDAVSGPIAGFPLVTERGNGCLTGDLEANNLAKILNVATVGAAYLAVAIVVVNLYMGAQKRAVKK